MAARGLRSFAVLTSLKTGITRLRDKGGASPSGLYDLVNGYVDISGAPVSRDGTTVNATLTDGTVGLVAFKGLLNVFALTNVSMPSGYVCNILINPNPAFSGTLDTIYFAEPFLGFLYVVAGFSDGSVYHYWLQSAGTWSANTQYQLNELVTPTTPNGYVYAATTQNNPPAWTANTQVSVGTVIQPSAYNGFQYVCTVAEGDNPSTGATEPTWPLAAGATVNEGVNSQSTPIVTTFSGGSGSPAGSNYDGLYPLAGSTP